MGKRIVVRDTDTYLPMERRYGNSKQSVGSNSVDA